MGKVSENGEDAQVTRKVVQKMRDLFSKEMLVYKDEWMMELVNVIQGKEKHRSDYNIENDERFIMRWKCGVKNWKENDLILRETRLSENQHWKDFTGAQTRLQVNTD